MSQGVDGDGDGSKRRSCVSDSAWRRRSRCFSGIRSGRSFRRARWHSTTFTPASGSRRPTGSAAPICRTRLRRSTGSFATIERTKRPRWTLDLLDLLHALRASLGSRRRFEVFSGYRSPATNAASVRGRPWRRRAQLPHRRQGDRRAAPRPLRLGCYAVQHFNFVAAASGTILAPDSFTSTSGPLRRW